MIYFNGKNLTDFGCYSDELDSLQRPEWDFDEVEVPGRNGTLTFSNGRLKNIDVSYDCMIAKDFATNYAGLMAFLQQDPEYHRLEGFAEKDSFRMARFKDSSDPKVSPWFQRATFSLAFDCKPQRFLKSGEVKIEVKSGESLYNQYLFNSQPFIRVYGYGTLYVGHYAVTISDYKMSYIDLDCETMDAYNGTTNLNAYVSMPSDNFPVLVPGENGIRAEGHITKIEITPRWWTV